MRQNPKGGVLEISQQKDMVIWRAEVLMPPKLYLPSSCVLCLCFWYIYLGWTVLFGDKCDIHLEGVG